MPTEASPCNSEPAKECTPTVEEARIESLVETHPDKQEEAKPRVHGTKDEDQQTHPEVSSSVSTETPAQEKQCERGTNPAVEPASPEQKRQEHKSRPHMSRQGTMCSELEASSPAILPPSELEAPTQGFHHFLHQQPVRGGPIPSPTPPPEEDETTLSPKSRVRFPSTPTPSHHIPQSVLPPTPPPSAPREERESRSKRVNFAAYSNAGSEAKYTPFGFQLDDLRLAALDKAQRYWELQNDVSAEGVAPTEKEARLEMLGRDLISDLHSLIEHSVALENVLKDERWRVWSTGTAVAAGIPAFCFLTQYPSLPFTLDPSKWTSSLPSLPAKTISTLHSVPAHPVARAAGRVAGRAAGAAAHAGGKAAGKAATAAHEGFMALSAATMALSLVPTAIGVIEVAFHERKLGDVQSWTEDLRHLAFRVGSGETVDGMDMYCLSDERWDELPWKAAEEDTRDLCY